MVNRILLLDILDQCKAPPPVHPNQQQNTVDVQKRNIIKQQRKAPIEEKKELCGGREEI